MEELTHMVQCRRLNATCDVGWHTIAAFDCEPIADSYAKECAGNTDSFEYRVQRREARTCYR